MFKEFPQNKLAYQKLLNMIALLLVHNELVEKKLVENAMQNKLDHFGFWHILVDSTSFELSRSNSTSFKLKLVEFDQF